MGVGYPHGPAGEGAVIGAVAVAAGLSDRREQRTGGEVAVGQHQHSGIERA
jgi:hypothetical protein